MKTLRFFLPLFRSSLCWVLGLAITGSVNAGERNAPRTSSATVTMSSNPDLSGVMNIYLDGRIDADVMGRLNTFAYLKGRNGVIVHLNSFGGSMRAGLALGRRIRELGFSTQVGVKGVSSISDEAGICESACVMLLAGGRFRLIQPDSVVGVHQFAAPDQATSQQVMADAQIFSAATVNFLRDMGVSTQLFSLMAVTPTSAMQKLSVADQVNLGLMNAGKEVAVWGIESEQGALVLKGVQSTISSTVEIQLACTAQQDVLVAVMVDAGGKGQVRSVDLLVDGRTSAVELRQPVQMMGRTAMSDFPPKAEQLVEMQRARSVGVRFRFDDQRQSMYAIDVPTQASALIGGFVQLCHGAQKGATVQR
ncbi:MULTISPECIES: hypothetical protein [Pseudomonas]|uniref:Uncharacterized protein n=2 Tax=Pseudomonas TaxID=286 RepID=A0A7X1GHV6_9PSED|nr:MULTISPECIES: hypothetical protein [Pseudomonas]MBC2692714.1 hypothetical protein [Pseudomonas kielensis]MDD1009362.1 hypothetical protein [Pseudomonas shahriarae]